MANKRKSNKKLINELNDVYNKQDNIYSEVYDIYTKVMSADVISYQEVLDLGFKVTSQVVASTDIEAALHNIRFSFNENINTTKHVTLILGMICLILCILIPPIGALLSLDLLVINTIIIPLQLSKAKDLLEAPELKEKQKEIGTMILNSTTFMKQKYEKYTEITSKEKQEKDILGLAETFVESHSLLEDKILECKTIQANLDEEFSRKRVKKTPKKHKK